MTLREHIAKARKDYLRSVLAESQNMPEAARKAGVHRASLYQMLEKYGIAIPSRMPRRHVGRCLVDEHGSFRA